MRVTKSDISLELDCWVDELSPSQLAAYEKVANEHNAIKNALKSALNANEGKELFNGEVFQAYSFKGKVLQALKEATVPKKIITKAAEAPQPNVVRNARKRPSNFVYLESSDEDDDDLPLAKRIASKKGPNSATPANPGSAQKPLSVKKGAATAASSGKASPQLAKTSKSSKALPVAKGDKGTPTASTSFRPSEVTSIGGLVIDTEANKEKQDSKDGNNKETKLQGKTFPSLVVLAKLSLKVKDMSATRTKLDSKVKLVLMLTPNKFTEWLIQEGLLKAQQTCSNHRNNELKLGVFSDATKFPYTGGYVWISECCPLRFVSVFHGSIFEGAPHPPSCILKLIYHWSCQTNIQNVVQWVKVDNVYIKGVYTWLRAICTLAIHQKCKKIGGPDKFVEVGVISLGTTSQDGQQRQVKVEVLGVLDHAEKTIRLRAVEPITDLDRNYKKRFQTILEPLQRWVHKDSIITIDLTVDKMTLYSMGFTNVVQAAATDTSAKHNNSTVMDYLRRIVPRMFQNTLSLLSRQMIQQFLDELVWREQFGTYALQAFNNITTHIAEQTRMTTNETLTQRLYQVATNPFKDWSILPANYKETPANTTPKRLKKPINEADYIQPEKVNVTKIKKEKETQSRDKSPTASSIGASLTIPSTKRRAAAIVAAANLDEEYRQEKKTTKSSTTSSSSSAATAVAPTPTTTTAKSTAAKSAGGAAQSKSTTASAKKSATMIETKSIKKEDSDTKGLEELYYGVLDGYADNFQKFPYNKKMNATTIDCPICDSSLTFDSNEKLQTHMVSHICLDGKDHQFQCLFCLEKHPTESVLAKHNQIIHPIETKSATSVSFHCLICPQRFNNLHYLTVHLQKAHNVLELPYSCQACGYRSSSHRDVVRHFYDDHKNQNFLQCPFCLDIFRFAHKGKLNVSNIENYYLHLRQHIGKKENQSRCPKCALSFIDKGSLKQHLANHHITLQKNAQNIRKLLNNSVMITPPKVRSHHREPLPFTMSKKFGDFIAVIDSVMCAECNSEIISEDHFTGIMKCNKCKFTTCCERSMFQHSMVCSNTERDIMEMPLPNEMHCICGFSTAIGNKMATHLVQCGQKSAYPTLHMAQENTVKRNMLDMLGLVRRDGEAGTDADTEPAQIFTTANNVQPISNSMSQLSHSTIVSGNTAEQSTAGTIQFGEIEATPVLDATMADAYSQLGNAPQEPEDEQQPAPQFQISFGQTDVQQHSLTTTDIDMPLIADLADANATDAQQYHLGDVHTPMFDAVAAAEQQHYDQLIHQPPSRQE